MSDFFVEGCFEVSWIGMNALRTVRQEDRSLRLCLGPYWNTSLRFSINPYPANLDNMVGSYQRRKWRMGFNSAFKGLKNFFLTYNFRIFCIYVFYVLS